MSKYSLHPDNSVARFLLTGALALAGMTLGLLGTAHGEEIPSDWKSIRAMGMGGSFTSIANDETGPFANPAGLAKTRNPRSKRMLHLFSFPGTAVSANGAGTKALSKSSGGAKDKLAKMISAASKDPSQPVYFEAQAFPAAIIGNRRTATYLIGFPTRSVTKISIPDSNKLTTAAVSSVSTASGILGMAGSSTRGGLNYGLSVRPNYRYTYIAQEYDITSPSFDKLKSDTLSKANKTSAVALDAGVMFTAADYWLPTLGLGVRNIPTGCYKNYVNPVTGDKQIVCGTLRSGAASSINNEDKIDPTEVRAGFSITPRFRMGRTLVNFRISVDAYPLPIKSGSTHYGPADLYLNKMLHSGAEISFGNAFIDDGLSFRGGMSQGMPTYGASIEFIGIAIDYASYFEDIGLRKQQRADRRHLLGVTTHW